MSLLPLPLLPPYCPDLLSLSLAALVAAEVRELFSPFDLKRLQSYAVYGQIDWHAVIDLLPTVAALYFAKRFPEEVNPSPVQSSVLCAMGLQRKSENEIAVRFLSSPLFLRTAIDDDPRPQTELDIPAQTVLAFIKKVIEKMTKSLQAILKEDVGRSLPSAEATAAAAAKLLPTPLEGVNGKSSGAASHLSAEQQVNLELEEEGNAVLKQLREEQREVIDSLDLKQ